MYLQVQVWMHSQVTSLGLDTNIPQRVLQCQQVGDNSKVTSFEDAILPGVQ